ncbi:MAG: NAD(P)/FAD-dependent oxidoreductase [Myxococcota bacterium]
MKYDVAILGAGIAGLSTAARLAARGKSTIVLEAHGQVGGCAGFFEKRGFRFDVGATTLVDFGPEGVGGELLREIGASLEAEVLPGYQAHLPDRQIQLHRDPVAWRIERKRLGDTPRHQRLWAFLDHMATVFWEASRNGVALPIRSLSDLLRAARNTPVAGWPLGRYLGATLGDRLRDFGLREEAPLCGLLSMLVEDTVHASLDEAPLVNAALGITIRGAGLSRPRGGMWGFWQTMQRAYLGLGGVLRRGCRVQGLRGRRGDFRIHTNRGEFEAETIVSALPLPVTGRLSPELSAALDPYLLRDQDRLGGAIVMFLGVPEDELDGQTYTHHQVLEDYRAPLGDGNNMFISTSSPGDSASAPLGHRAVMISTHTRLAPWQDLPAEDYEAKKAAIGRHLLRVAQTVYPRLGHRPVVFEIGTPRTYERFTGRPQGAVGGTRLSPRNANQHAVPHDLGIPGLWVVGDGTWPGLGTVAGVLASRIVADRISRVAQVPLATRALEGAL